MNFYRVAKISVSWKVKITVSRSLPVLTALRLPAIENSKRSAVMFCRLISQRYFKHLNKDLANERLFKSHQDQPWLSARQLHAKRGRIKLKLAKTTTVDR